MYFLAEEGTTHKDLSINVLSVNIKSKMSEADVDFLILKGTCIEINI